MNCISIFSVFFMIHTGLQIYFLYELGCKCIFLLTCLHVRYLHYKEFAISTSGKVVILIFCNMYFVILHISIFVCLK